MTRERLPTRRRTERHELAIAGHVVLVDLGRQELGPLQYDDGPLLEIFVGVDHKEGAPFRDVCVALARCMSLALQHGVPVEVLVRAWLGLTGLSGAVTGHEVIRGALSIPDLVARLVAVEVLGRTDAEIVSPEAPAT